MLLNFIAFKIVLRFKLLLRLINFIIDKFLLLSTLRNDVSKNVNLFIPRVKLQLTIRHEDAPAKGRILPVHEKNELKIEKTNL